MGQHIFDSVSSTLTPTRSNFVAPSAWCKHGVCAKECPPQNVGGLFWHSAPGGGGLEVRAAVLVLSSWDPFTHSCRSLPLRSHLSQTLDPTTAEHNIPFKHCFTWVCKHESKTFQVCLLFSKSEHVMQLVFMSNLIINVSPIFFFFCLIPTPRGIKCIYVSLMYWDI